MKTHYEILGLDPSADAETIKKAFRREIAKYHPDKVIHLGHEFQEMAAVRAAELTVAYKTLTDPALRADYDQGLGDGPPTPKPAPPPAAEDPDLAETSAEPAPPVDEYRPSQAHTAPPGGRNFASERAGRDVILRRAMAVRVHNMMENLYGPLQTPNVRGFDLAVVPTAMPRFLGSPPPRVLVKVVELADAAAVNEAWASASRARIHVPKSPLAVLLFAKHIAPQGDLARALDALARQRKAPDGPDELSVVVVDVSDWSARLPANVSAVVRKLVDKLRG